MPVERIWQKWKCVSSDHNLISRQASICSIKNITLNENRQSKKTFNSSQWNYYSNQRNQNKILWDREKVGSYKNIEKQS